ncbi:hypothetical protein F5Y07DRAFT_382267 [Xylaria sp. FL0933]|nr:hypothetical protein F5Y07DRAFT_382267 [Xylaria sp. FL0933]
MPTQCCEPSGHVGDLRPNHSSSKDNAFDLALSALEFTLHKRASVQDKMHYDSLLLECHEALAHLTDIFSEKSDGVNRVDALFNTSNRIETATVDSDMSQQLSTLGKDLFNLYTQTDRVDYLTAAVSAAYGAALLTDHSSPSRAGRLNDIIVLLLIAYKRTSRDSFLDEAISIAYKAINSMTINSRNDASDSVDPIRNNLGSALASRYERAGDFEDLEDAICIVTSVIKERPDDDDRPNRLRNLSNMYLRRYERTGSAADVNKAVSCAKEAAEYAPYRDDADRASRYTDYSNALTRRYEQGGDEEDLRLAICKAHEAVELTGKYNPDVAKQHNPELASRKSNFGSLLYMRYQQTGATEDLTEAIKQMEEALKLMPDNHVHYRRLQNNLAAMLLTSYEKTLNEEDLRKSVLYATEAVKAAKCPDHHSDSVPPDYAWRLNTLSKILLEKYHMATDPINAEQILDEAIKYAQMAVRATRGLKPKMSNAHTGSPGIAWRGIRRSLTGLGRNLDNMLSERRKGTQAARGTRSDHQDLVDQLKHLGTALMIRYDRRGDEKDLAEANSIAVEVSNIIGDDDDDV